MQVRRHDTVSGTHKVLGGLISEYRGDGYRYDHAFCSRALRDQVMACDYVHQPRLDKLSDHSALSVRLSLAPPGGLLASDPAAPSAPPTLF